MFFLFPLHSTAIHILFDVLSPRSIVFQDPLINLRFFEEYRKEPQAFLTHSGGLAPPSILTEYSFCTIRANCGEFRRSKSTQTFPAIFFQAHTFSDMFAVVIGLHLWASSQ